LQNPAFTVELKDFEKPYFIASGQVTRPGKYELRGDTTVAQAVAVAGGFNEKAKHSQVLLFRRVSDEWVEVKQLDMKKMFQEANLSEDLHLQPGDMLFVPQNFLSKVKSFIPAARMSLSPSDF
jgi:polysaccharide export outer membrane protein